MTGKPKLVLHVGAQRIITNALRARLTANGDALAAQGVLFFTGKQDGAQSVKADSLFAASIKGADAVAALRDTWAQALHNSGCTTLLVSEEGLSGPGLVRNKIPANIESLAQTFDIRVVALLSRQDLFVEALWQHNARLGLTKAHITDFVALPGVIQHMTYLGMLDAWSQHVPVSALSAPYLLDDATLARFSAAAGIDVPATGKTRTAHPDMSAAALMVAMNRLDIAFDWRKVEKNRLRDVRRHALGSMLRNDLLSRFADHNQELAERYGVVFSDTMPREPRSAIPAPTDEDVSKAIVDLASTELMAETRNPSADPARAKAPVAAQAGDTAAPAAPAVARPRKPRLLIHIGTHKTATSTLQALMSSNRDMLADQGFLYARTDRQPFPTKFKHAFFGKTMVEDRAAFAVLHRKIMKEFKASGAHTLVLSEEGLSTPMMSKALAPLTMYAREFDIEAVCYLRRQDYFAESFWNFRCKIGEQTETIADFIQRRRFNRYMRYMEMLERWAQFGKVTAVGFEAAVEVGIVESFSKVTGMTLPPAHKSRNISPSMSLAAVLAVMNRDGAVKDWQRIEPLLGPSLRRTALGSRLRKELLAKFTDHNARLFDRYGVVFPDTMPEEAEDPIAEPSAEEIARIRAALAAKVDLAQAS